MKRYVLNSVYRFRGWHRLPAGLLDTRTKTVRFFPIPEYTFLLQCDGAHDICPETLSDAEGVMLNRFLEQGLIHEAASGELLQQEQVYRAYPAGYRREVHWAITGACNLRCRHCFMSAPSARRGSPAFEDLIRIMDQIAECGIFHVGITGGEPLIRDDFFLIIDELNRREISVSAIYTNGWLVNEDFLNELEARNVRPSFQLSFDGMGHHDFLRGIDGAEQRTIAALDLLHKRGYEVHVSMCLHRGNLDSIRESVNLLARLGAVSLKIGPMADQGEWAAPEMRHLHLTNDEMFAAFESYIPQYFADNAPLSIILGGAFACTKGEKDWRIVNELHIPAEKEAAVPSCMSLVNELYIDPEGAAVPCMAMAEADCRDQYPNVYETPLSEILKDSDFMKRCFATVKDVREGNEQCRSCAYIDRCAGGCRACALEAGNYYGADPEACDFFRHGWQTRIEAAAAPAFESFRKRVPADKEDRPSSGKTDCR